MDARLAVVVMAAGKGTRMNNPSVAKVMYTINERPLVVLAMNFDERAADGSQRLGADRLVVDEGPGSPIGHLHASQD